MKKEINIFVVSGMACNHCKNSLEVALKSLNGIESVSIDLKTQEIEVEYNSEVISLAQISNLIEEKGYGVL